MIVKETKYEEGDIMNWIDIIIIIILIVNALKGLTRGFILSIFNLLGFILSAYIAKLYYLDLSKYIIDHTSIFEKIRDFVLKRLDLFIIAKAPDVIKNRIFSGQDMYSNTGQMSILDQSILADKLANVILNLISIVIIFFAARIIIMAIGGLIQYIAELPVLKQLNRLGGFVFGVLKGLLWIYFIFLLATPIILLSPDGFIAKSTFNSTLGVYFYNNNIILKLLKDGNLFK